MPVKKIWKSVNIWRRRYEQKICGLLFWPTLCNSRRAKCGPRSYSRPIQYLRTDMIRKRLSFTQSDKKFRKVSVKLWYDWLDFVRTEISYSRPSCLNANRSSRRENRTRAPGIDWTVKRLIAVAFNDHESFVSGIGQLVTQPAGWSCACWKEWMHWMDQRRDLYWLY